MLKLVHGKLTWTDKTEWHFPLADKGRMDTCFKTGATDVEAAIAMFSPHLKQRRTCIQAGGAMGIWPLRLAQLFDRVYTFEAHPTNYECLARNVGDHPAIRFRHAALYDRSGESVGLDLTDDGNTGAYFVNGPGSVQTVAIDDLSMPDVDLLYLDIEGCEWKAIEGARTTIERSRPIIGIEDKHRERFGHPNIVADICREFGYVVVGRPNRLDVIMRPE